MKFFGNKGKLFGKLNIIDLILLLLVIAVVAFMGYKLLGGSQETATSDALPNPNFRFAVLCEKLPLQVAQSVLKNAGPQAEETIFDEPSRIFNVNQLYDAQITTIEVQEREDGYVDLLITIEGVPTKSDIGYSLGLQEIRIGKEYTVKTQTIELEGTIIATEVLDG
ncbi:MAG: DUF4330 domain-containing protein [Oscillospiraceae bacterium]|jgi:hypothetical protein|nr:DUF4330 domain-containing protein [Oscillospiraceae bacterium]